MSAFSGREFDSRRLHDESKISLVKARNGNVLGFTIFNANTNVLQTTSVVAGIFATRIS